MEEIWKDIKGYEGLYEVSNIGRVRSLNKRKKRVLKNENGYGYLRVSLSKNNKLKHFQVHRLVAQSFIPNVNNFPEVNHINGVKDDNRVENLEWCTRNENELHCYKNNPELHKTSVVNQYDLEGNFIKQWSSIKEAQLKLGINNVSACCNNRRKKAGGYIWKYERKYRNE